MADHRAGFATNQFERIRIALLGERAATGRIRFGLNHEGKFFRREEDQFFGPSTEMERDERQGLRELNGEIAIAGGIKTIVRGSIETKLGGHSIAIQRQGGSSNRT